MKILVMRTIHYYISRYPVAERALISWANEFSKIEADNFNDIKAVYGNASIVANNRVILNIKGNNFRLIVSVNFRQRACYIIWFGTHREYDNIDVETVPYDTSINNYKK
jgi:mRNA interferase HigB